MYLPPAFVIRLITRARFEVVPETSVPDASLIAHTDLKVSISPTVIAPAVLNDIFLLSVVI